MHRYITNQGINCFYGSLANIIYSAGIPITEAELVLFSNALNCSYMIDDSNMYFGIPIQMGYSCLKSIGISVHSLKNMNELSAKLLEVPVLLKVNTSTLVHSDVYKGTSRTHFIVLLSLNGNEARISDSFISSIPRSFYEGVTDITRVIQNCIISKDFGTVLILNSISEAIGLYQKEKENAYERLISYAKANITMSENSVIRKFQILSQYMLDHTKEMLIDNHVNEFVYMIKYNGAIDRLLYLIQLVQKYCNDPKYIVDRLSALYGKWVGISNKLLKCAILNNLETYKLIFKKDIPTLINEERSLYFDFIKMERSL